MESVTCLKDRSEGTRRSKVHTAPGAPHCSLLPPPAHHSRAVPVLSALAGRGSPRPLLCVAPFRRALTGGICWHSLKGFQAAESLAWAHLLPGFLWGPCAACLAPTGLGLSPHVRLLPYSRTEECSWASAGCLLPGTAEKDLPRSLPPLGVELTFHRGPWEEVQTTNLHSRSARG